jgi:hypothetical protein
LCTAFTDVNPVEQLVDITLVDQLALLAADIFSAEFSHQVGCRADLDEPVENHPDGRGFGLVHDQLAIFHVIAERNKAAHPHAFLAGGRKLVAYALADHLTLELSEGKQDIEREPPHRGRGVERLGDADKCHAVAVEGFDEFGKIHQRTAEAIDLVDHDHVDTACFDVGQQALQRRPLQRRAGNSAVIVTVRHQQPALGLLAGDVGLAGLALGIERIELRLQSLLAGLADVDRATELAHDRLLHDALPQLLSPKKVSPFHRVRVMARAMAESDL